MSLDCYRLLSQLGAGPDGVAYRAVGRDGETEVEVVDLKPARQDPRRWRVLAPRLRVAARLEHPSAIRIVELELEDDRPYAVLEWIGATTLAASVAADGPKNRRDAIAIARNLTAALKAAHRLGLPHGWLAPDQVLLAGGTEPKLNFSGAAVGFPPAPEPINAGDRAALDHAANEAAARAADLYSLGALIAWLVSGSHHRFHDKPSGVGLIAGSSLGDLVDELLAADPAERPSAREVQQRLDELLAPMDATGNWAMPCEGTAPSSFFSQANEFKSLASAEGSKTLAVNSPVISMGRYRLLEKLGEGAQGVVHRALDPSDGSVVAIKILRTDRIGSHDVVRRFRKEARLMAEANNPYVVNLLEFNEDDGVPYMVLEFVAGESLGHLLAQRNRLDEREALSIMAAVARGLMQAHERGIVHRDIKPSNILLIEPPQRSAIQKIEQDLFASNGERESGFMSDANAPSLASTSKGTIDGEAAMPRVKLSDFGLARHVVDSESMALTAAGALLGTPHYMAPEQWTGRGVDSRTDVYAMGATLFHLLAGRPPFAAETRDDLAVQHCNEPPPRLRAMNMEVSDGVARVIDRALSKHAEDRYADAGAMLRDMEALLEGRPTDLAIHPRLPECDPQRVVQFEFRWELESSPRQLWPLVTNTDRFDRAIGFPPLNIKTRYEEGRGVRTFIEGRKAGMVELGEEHPYEWIEPRRMGVFREYSAGPFRWLVSVVELLPRPGGGTTLIHRLSLEPSSWKIRVGSRWGVGVTLRKTLERVYQRIDATLKSQRLRGVSPAVDEFAEPAVIPPQRRQRLERVLDRLIEQGVDSEVVDQLGEYLAFGPPQELARIRPLALAERLQLDPAKVVAACLWGAHLGLLELHWDLLCPVCRISCQVSDTLRAIAEHAHCEACNLDFQLDFARSIELIFRVHPEIREADLRIYCVGGPAHSPHVLAQIRIAPHERIELELELAAGNYRVRGPQLAWSLDFQVQSTATIRRWDIDLTAAPQPGRFQTLRAGGQILIIKNSHSRELVIRVERTAMSALALTAARATSLALFRELFPGEMLAPGQLATVSMVTLMVTALDPEQADALYRDLGDTGAFGVVHEHLQYLAAAIRAGGGAVVKTMGEGVMASFGNVTSAVRTALDLVPQLARGKATHTLRQRVAIHRGATVAATLNDQLDYFGTTARQTIRILETARGDELVLTQAVAADPEVAGLLAARRIEGEVVPSGLAGHSHLIRVRMAGVMSE
jgi:serine/threonine protein kinase/class 3 adenylate cyclase